MYLKGVTTFLLLLDASQAFALLPKKTCSVPGRKCGALNGLPNGDMSYSLLASTTTNSPSSPRTPPGESESSEGGQRYTKEQTLETQFTLTDPEASDTNSDQTATTMTAPKPRRTRIVLQESTFSSSSTPVRTVRKQTPTQQCRTMLTPKLSSSSSAATTPATTTKGENQYFFIVNDEMGRPINPAPTTAPKGLFEIRNEMGEVITPPSPAPRKTTPPTVSNQRAKQDELHIQDEDGTTIAPPPAPAPSRMPRSGLSKFTETQQLFTVSGIPDFGVSNEMLQLSGRPRRRQVKWRDVNNSVPSGQYDAHNAPIRVTEESLVTPPVTPPMASSPPVVAPEQAPPETIPDPVPAPLNELSSAPIEEEELFVVRDEMGKQILPTPTQAPKGLFEVRDEMGNVINPPSQKRQKSPTASSTTSIPKSGLSKFAATKELFKVSGMSEFAIPSEMQQL